MLYLRPSRYDLTSFDWSLNNQNISCLPLKNRKQAQENMWYWQCMYMNSFECLGKNHCKSDKI